jgi:hypothetical protein
MICQDFTYPHHKERFAVSAETTTGDALSLSTKLNLYSTSPKNGEVKVFCNKTFVICQSLRSFAYPPGQLTPNARETDVVDRSAITVVLCDTGGQNARGSKISLLIFLSIK